MRDDLASMARPWPASPTCSRPTTSVESFPISCVPSSSGPSAWPWPASPAPPRLLVARDMRESGVELSRAFADGARSVGVAVIDLGLASTDLLYFAAGSLDAPGAMFTASHNPARYNGLKLCLSGARPIGRDTGLAEIQATAESLLDEWGDRGPAPVDPDGHGAPRGAFGARGLRRTRPLLRRRRRAAHPCRWWPTPPTAWAGWSCPRCSRASPSRWRSSFPSSTGTSPTIRPIPSSRRTWSPSSGRCSTPAPTSAWPSTGTPTGCSWSTRGPSRCRAR